MFNMLHNNWYVDVWYVALCVIIHLTSFPIRTSASNRTSDSNNFCFYIYHIRTSVGSNSLRTSDSNIFWIWIPKLELDSMTQSQKMKNLLNMSQKIESEDERLLLLCFWNWALYRLIRFWYRYIVKYSFWNSFNLQYAWTNTNCVSIQASFMFLKISHVSTHT